MYVQVEALYNSGCRDVVALEAAAAAAAARVGIELSYIAFNRQTDGYPLNPGGPHRKKTDNNKAGAPLLLLPSNDEVCVSVAFAAAADCFIVDNFVLSDTQQ